MTRCLFACVAALQVTAGAFAQQVVTFEFSFSNPGARSLGFGGAFTALADDATAAYANPAGLVQLVEPEVSLEGRSWSYSTPFVAGGRAQGSPTGIGLDTTPGLRQGESTADFTGLSFLSFVYPFQRWSIAFYRHQMAWFETSIEVQGLFADGSDGVVRFFDQRGSSSTEIINYGVSSGVRISDSLSLGIGLSHLEAEHFRQGAAYLPDDDSTESFFGENHFLSERRIWQDAYAGDGSGQSLIAGLLWRASQRWSAGAFYRSGFEIEIATERLIGPATPPPGRIDPGVANGWRFSFSQDFPAVLGLGVAYRSDDGRLTSSLEWDHVAYSDISAGDPNETIPDADEIHLGAEYAFLRASPVVALRLGAWLDPDHRIRATQGGTFFRARLQPGEDEIHLAAGLGLAFKAFQVDLAVDLSDQVDTASVSAIYSF